MTDDAATTEVLGFILMFALSAIILLVSLSSFTAAKENSNDLVAAVELKNIANRISTRIVQASIASQEFPRVDFAVAMKIPDNVAGYRYTIQFRDRDAWATCTLNVNCPDPIVYLRTEGHSVEGGSSTLTGESSLFKVNEVNVNGEVLYLEPNVVRPTTGSIVVRYWFESELDMTKGVKRTVQEGHLEIVEGTI